MAAKLEIGPFQYWKSWRAFSIGLQFCYALSKMVLKMQTFDL
jgi:hypothetical protein